MWTQLWPRLLRYVDLSPETAEQVFGQGYTFVHMADPDQGSLQIARRAPDLSMIQPLFSKVASELDMALYDAGSLREQDEHRHYFTDFADWDRRYPLPSRWRRVV